MEYKLQLCIIKELKAKNSFTIFERKKSVNIKNLDNHENTDEICACNTLNITVCTFSLFCTSYQIFCVFVAFLVITNV